MAFICNSYYLSNLKFVQNPKRQKIMEQELGKKHKKVDNVKNDEEKPCKKEKTCIKKCVTKTTGKKIKPLVDAWHAGV